MFVALPAAGQVAVCAVGGGTGASLEAAWRRAGVAPFNVNPCLPSGDSYCKALLHSGRSDISRAVDELIAAL